MAFDDEIRTLLGQSKPAPLPAAAAEGKSPAAPQCGGAPQPRVRTVCADLITVVPFKGVAIFKQPLGCKSQAL